MKTEKKYFDVVNIADDGEITVLQSIFKYDDGFKGATGSKFYPISKDEYNEIINKSAEEIAEYLMESGFELPKDKQLYGFLGWAEDFETDDRENLYFDSSYREHWEELRNQTGLTEIEAFAFNCVGGGRCFDANFKGNKNEELCKLIREIESK